MKLRELPFRAYYHGIFPFIKGIRGTTRLLLLLERFWLRGEIRDVGDHYETVYDGVNLKAVEWDDLTDIYREEHLETYLERYTPGPGDTVIDAGAFPGILAVFLSKKVEDIRIIALEPDPENRNHLRDNLELNDVESVEIIPAALWNTNGETAFVKKGDETSRIEEVGEDRTETVTIDELVADRDIETIDFIKMDIEGAEIEALQGGQKTIQEGCRIAIKSYHLRDGKKTSNRVEEILRGLGRSPETIKKLPRERVTYA